MELIKFSLVVLLATISPGPDFALILRNSLRYSKKIGFYTLFGVILADCFHMSYCYLGLNFVLKNFPKIFELIQIFGACYLMYLGLNGLLMKKNLFKVNHLYSQNQVSFLKSFFQGFFLSTLNPKSIIFFINLVSVFFSENILFKDFLFYVLIVVLVNLIWFSLIILFIQLKTVKNFLTKHGLIFERFIGLALFLLGFKILLDDEIRL